LMASLHPLSRTSVSHSSDSPIFGNGRLARYGKSTRSQRPWSAMRHLAGNKDTTTRSNPIPHYDWWSKNGSMYQLDTRDADEIKPHLHDCFPADRRSAEWDHQRDVASQEGLSMRVNQEMLDLEFVISTVLPKIKNIEKSISLAIDDVEQQPVVKFRLDRIDCVFRKSQVPLRPASVEHLDGEKFHSIRTFQPGGDFYIKCQSAGDHAARLAYVHRYHKMADDAKAHLVMLQAMYKQISNQTHVRVEQQQMLDDLEAKRLAVLAPSERDTKLRALFHTFDLDCNGVVDKDEFFIIGQAIYGRTQWSQELNDQAFALVDKDVSGEIDEDEFIFIFTQNMLSMKDKLFDKMINTYADRATIAGQYRLGRRSSTQATSNS